MSFANSHEGDYRTGASDVQGGAEIAGAVQPGKKAQRDLKTMCINTPSWEGVRNKETDSSHWHLGKGQEAMGTNQASRNSL